MQPYLPETMEDARTKREWTAFGRQLYRHWQAWIGSILAIPAIVLWQAQGGSMTTWVVIGLSLVGLLWGAFLAWRDQFRLVAERDDRLQKLECENEALKNPPSTVTRFILEFDELAHHCLSDWVSNKTLCYRINVTHDHQANAVTGCYGCLVRVEKDGIRADITEIHKLPFAPCQSLQATNKVILAGEMCQLDFLAIGYDGPPDIVLMYAVGAQIVIPATAKREAVFMTAGDYHLYISVHGVGIAAKYAHLLFHWAGSRDGSKMSMIETSDKPL